MQLDDRIGNKLNLRPRNAIRNGFAGIHNGNSMNEQQTEAEEEQQTEAQEEEEKKTEELSPVPATVSATERRTVIFLFF